MAFQPILDCEANAPFAFEALVRGPQDQPAATILDAVDADNLYAFDQACRVKAIEAAMAAGLMETPARLSINFLPNAVYSPLACIQLTLKTATACALPLDRLIFEFTESEHMASAEHVEKIIDSYKRMGFAVAIDDFGAGFAGLGLFARFKPDMVKIDMELVRDIDTSARKRAIVGGVVAMCAELDTLVIAEGIETAAEAQTLRQIGVRYLQGYFFARPGFERLPVAAFAG
jgi:EAL domain-containing protein (putative c-di-GMP-specific phosphodiesterase class I)